MAPTLRPPRADRTPGALHRPGRWARRRPTPDAGAGTYVRWTVGRSRVMLTR
ncbi:hypothetical protein [Cellulomonas iranensis]|uniref:hypothetical protein n=1 Tax=Cellulomonas iranensis TaxID=76862 RepID=UPI0015C6150C|nr:hypothetical protein [Cellulomonas iranensis]